MPKVKRTDQTQQPLLQRTGSTAKPSKTGWYLFRKVKLFSMVHSYIQKRIDVYRQKKALREFRIRHYEHAEPQIALRQGITVNRVGRHMEASNNQSVQSLEDWTKELYRRTSKAMGNGKTISRDDAEAEAYRIYEHSKPRVRKLSPKQKLASGPSLERLNQQYQQQGIYFSPQSDDESEHPRSPGDMSPTDASREFAFRITPTDDRKNNENYEARITINFLPNFAIRVADLLAQLTAENSGFDDIIIESKILGPEELGNRTDSAVVYLNDNPEKAKQLARHISNQLKGCLIEHTPAGMHEMATGISYAETVQGDDSSYGQSRGKMVAAAVMAAVENPLLDPVEELHRLLKEKGYDPDSPAHVLRE